MTNTKDAVLIIPARIGSTRLPNKVLADINGLPMITHIIRRAKKSIISNIVVATDSNDVIKIAIEEGVTGIMTDSNLQSGTDRVYAALKKLNINYEYIINLQGDMPNIEPYIISQTLELIKSDSKIEIATAICELNDISSFNVPSVVKVALSYDTLCNKHKALYFSRSCIPNGIAQKYSHLGIYGYTKAAIEKFVQLEPSQLELSEKLEQLRALEAGMSIYCTIVNDFPISVDVPEDLEKARNLMKI